MRPYYNTPVQTVFQLAHNGDKEACMELSFIYAKGGNLIRSEYWRMKAEIKSKFPKIKKNIK